MKYFSVLFVVFIGFVVLLGTYILTSVEEKSLSEQIQQSLPSEASKDGIKGKVSLKTVPSPKTAESSNKSPQNIDKDLIIANLRAGIEKIKSVPSPEAKPRISDKDSLNIKQLDEKLNAIKPTDFLLNKDGQLAGIYPQYSKKVQDADEFIALASDTLAINERSTLRKLDDKCIRGQCVTEYQRTVQGVPVLNSSVKVSITDGIVRSVAGGLSEPNVSKQMIASNNNLTNNELLAIAKNVTGNERLEFREQTIYGVFQNGANGATAYKIDVSDGFEGYNLIIHSTNKAILLNEPHLMHANATGIDLDGNTFNFSVEQAGSQYQMIDTALKTALVDDSDSYFELDEYVYGQNQSIISSNSLNSGWNASAVSALSHFKALVDYFASIDYAVDSEIEDGILILVEFDGENAIAGNSIMGFGKTQRSNYARDRSVVAHELSHIIIRNTSKLVYRGQSGALNEGFADLFGVLASNDSNWKIGEDIRQDGSYLRNMANPNDELTRNFDPIGYPQPAHMNQYVVNGSVHENSGIINRFHYLLAEGNADEGHGSSIGKATTGELAFDTMLALPTNATFAQFYKEVESLAIARYSANSEEHIAVITAGEQVGFVALVARQNTTIINTTDTTVDNGENATAYLSPNFITGAFDLYLQLYSSNTRTYAESIHARVAVDLLGMAPAITSTSTDSSESIFVLYKKLDESIEQLVISADTYDTSDVLDSNLGQYLNKITFSRDLVYVAYTTDGLNDNEITIIDLDTSEDFTISPTTESYTEGFEGFRVKTVDSVQFDVSSRHVLFDYSVCSVIDSDDCFWSVGIYDISSAQISYPFNGVGKEFDIGNPSFANRNPNVIAVDVINKTTNEFGVYTVDLEEEQIYGISQIRLTGLSASHSGRPAFTQDDSALIFTVRVSDSPFETYLYSSPLSENYDVDTNKAGDYLNSRNRALLPSTVAIEIIDASPTLDISTTNVDLGGITTNSSGEVCFENSSSYPISVSLVSASNGLEVNGIDNYYSSGERTCQNLTVNVSKLELGKFDLMLNMKHNGVNSPALVSFRGEKLSDFDGDGIPDITDTDDDNDGVLDTADAYPLIAIGGLTDTDNDGAPDACDEACISLGMTADTDDDNDGVSDTADAYPLIAIGALTDTDGDGAPDACDEACVLLGMAADTDDDNDGVLDTADAFPLDANESVDTDLDGIGNNADTDDDNDGILDEDDSAPLDGTIGDDESPVFSELVDVTFEATGTTTDLDLVVPEVTDNNLNAPTIVSNYSDALSLGTHEIEWTATDFAGNVTTAIQLVTIVDTTNAKFDELQIQTIDAMGILNDVSDAINNIQAYDLVDGSIYAVIIGDRLYPSGVHLVNVSATDSSGNIAEAEVEVHIVPLVELSQSRKVEPGATVLLPVTLSGNAAIYPVGVTYTLMQSGSIIQTNELLIAEGISGVITIEIPSNTLNSDIYSVAITSASNATLGFVTSTQLMVDETNLTPTLTLVTQQDDKNISVIDTKNGVVTVTAIVKDMNANDTHDIVWSSLTDTLVDLNTDGLASTFEFSPEGVTTGTYKLTVSVSESNTNELYRVFVDKNIVVDAVLAALDANTDSDNDGISDADEGYSDSDNDGISDYLDTDDNPSRLPIDDSTAAIQTVNGLSLSLGDVVTTSNGATAANATVDVNDITNDKHFTTLSSITNFNVSGLTEVGQSVPIVIPLAIGTTIVEGSIYRKYSDAKGWFDFVVDSENGVYSALADENGNCPYPQKTQYQEGLTVGDNCILLLIKDGGENDADGLTNGMVKDPGVLTSEVINQAPVIVINTNEVANEGSVVTFDASATTDAEDDMLTYQWLQLTGATVELSGQETSTLSFTAPQVSNDELLTFELTVNDGRDSSSTVVEVLVLQVNIAPTVSIDSHVSSFDEGDPISLKATGADEDADALSYAWEQTSGPTVTLSGASSASVTFTAPAVSNDQTLEFKVTVSDGVDTASKSTTVTVKNAAPVTPPTPTPESGGSGGSMGWVLIVIGFGLLRKRQIKVAA